MSSWTTLHISTLNPYSLPEPAKLEKAVNLIRSCYYRKFDLEIEPQKSEVVLYTYGSVRTIERTEAWNSNELLVNYPRIIEKLELIFEEPVMDKVQVSQ